MAARCVDALILWSGDPPATVAFYRAIGVPLEEERHGDGPLHWACALGTAHLAVYEASAGRAIGRRAGGGTQVGLQVDDVDAALAAAVALGARVLQPPEQMAWGRRCVVEDPDGRAVELNQA